MAVPKKVKRTAKVNLHSDCTLIMSDLSELLHISFFQFFQIQSGRTQTRIFLLPAKPPRTSTM